MKLTAYRYNFRSDARLQAAPQKRQWMDNVPNHFAYRCLPLVIANAHGWEVLCSCAVSARWNGGPNLADVIVTSEQQAASSHFGSGILTFMVPYLFRTDPGVNLMVQGPINRPKDGIAALTAVVETDWTVASFTMNWKFTRPGQVKFEKGEPYCHLFPVTRNLATVQPKLANIVDDPELCAKFIAWGESRVECGKAQAHDPQHWERDYNLGKDAPDDHQKKLKLAEFT